MSRSQWPRGLRLSLRPLASWDRGFESHRGAWMFVCCECCVLSGRGFCDVIYKPQVRGGHGPRLAAAPQEEKKSCLFNDAGNTWKYAASNGRMISEQWNDRDVQGRSFDLIRSSVRPLSGGTEGNRAKFFFSPPTVLVARPGFDRASPEYKSAGLAVG